MSLHRILVGNIDPAGDKLQYLRRKHLAMLFSVGLKLVVLGGLGLKLRCEKLGRFFKADILSFF